MSLMDYTSVKEVKVLNVYPDIGDNLKTWMEDNKDSSTGQMIGKGIIKVDKIAISSFNTNPSEYLYKTDGKWNYDIIVFGFWDRNNCRDLSSKSKDIVNNFISDGNGCIFGHDVALNNAARNTDTYEVTGGTAKRGQTNFDELARKCFPFMTWKSGSGEINLSSSITVSKKGLFTSYPWNLGEVGTKYTIPKSHTWGQQLSDTSNVWLTLGESVIPTSDNFYLVTNNNCAMIMTGHSKGQSTEAEQKLLANLLFYCYQISSGTSVTDNSAMDNAAPDKPTIARNGNNFVLASKDNGVTYQHKIEAYDPINTSTLIDTSNVTSSTVISGFKGYRYIYNNAANTKITGVNGTAITNDIIPYDSRYGYLHVAAVDNAGNVSETATVEINLHQITYKTDTIYPSDTTAAGVAGGKITRTSEIVAGNNAPLGSTATAYNCYTFDGWYSSTGELITKDATIKPLNCNAEDRGGFIYSAHGGSSVYDASADVYMVTTDIRPEEGTAKETWGSGVYHHSNTEIPWNNWYIAEFEICSPIDAECAIDINNWGPNGHSWSGNDNDNNETRFFNQNGNNPIFPLKANMWKKIVIGYQNSSGNNINHESLWDQHTINLRYNKSLGNQTFKVRNYKAAVSPTLIKELDTFTARFKPWTHTVAYNANGGIGAPASKVKYFQSYFYISSTVPTRTGYTFKNWNTKKDGSGIAYNPGQDYIFDQNGGTVTLYAQWTVNTYTNLIGHWAEGFKYNEGNNSWNGNRCFLIANTTFQSCYNSVFTMDSTKTVKIPNGYYLKNVGTLEKDGIFKNYSMGLKLTQKSASMGFEYYYTPTLYSITYDLNGGINDNSNPSTYNVLYGVSLKVPTRAGYTFTGWYDEKGNKVTGINEGCNATFSSADDLYAKLAKRTTGNRTLTARWSYNPVKVKVPQMLIGDHTGRSQFRVKCDDFKAGSIKISVPNSFLYEQTGKADVTAAITSKSGNNTITPTNKVCVYNITTKNGLTAGCWQGSFNIGLTLTKE